MRIAILGGGGAMGGLFGGYLARAGNDVTLIDVSRPAVTAINSNGLSIEEKDGSAPVIKGPGQRRSCIASVRSISSSTSSNAITPKPRCAPPRR